MPLPELALAIFVLLVTPGPTNTLLAIAGAERGWTRALPLIPVEIAGYLTTILPLVSVGATIIAHLPVLKLAIALIAAAWVLWLALRMWRISRPDRNDPGVTAWRIYVTTMLNPKALIFGLVLLPAATAWGLALNLGLFVGQILLVAAVWAALGAALSGRSTPPGLPDWLRRAAALWLGAIALWLVSSVLRTVV